MPSAGDLKERVRFERRTASDDGFGNQVTGFAAEFERAAMYLMRPGSEAVQAARLEGRQSVTIIVRFDSRTRTIASDWRAVDVRTGETFAIRAAADMDRRREWISITAMAGEAS